ncbi:MAG TPA: hypothetical protein VMV10_11070 [Pirellulales bacterium]|nr:hypothetical protein [Pirellulales bacterium]
MIAAPNQDELVIDVIGDGPLPAEAVEAVARLLLALAEADAPDPETTEYFPAI